MSTTIINTQQNNINTEKDILIWKIDELNRNDEINVMMHQELNELNAYARKHLQIEDRLLLVTC